MQKDFTVSLLGCEYDTFTQVLWDSTGTAQIIAYDHIINEDTNIHGFSTIVNSMSICTQQYYFIEEETSTGVWTSYSGSLVTLDEMAETLTIASSTSDFGLDQ